MTRAGICAANCSTNSTCPSAYQLSISSSAHCRIRGGTVAEAAFARGLCLPSGSSLTDADFDRVCAVVLGVQRQS